MSTINIKTNGNVTTIYGPDMTNDFEQMMRECCGRFDNFLFGDVTKVVGILKDQGRSPMTKKEVEKLDAWGGNADYYKGIYCYLCVNKKDYRNYMFSPEDAENKDKSYRRLRMGVLKFSQEDFDVWIVDST